MQEDLEPFGVKIESSFPAQAEAEARRSGKPRRANQYAGAREEVQGRIGNGALPEPVHVTDDEILSIGAEDAVVGGGGGAVPLNGKSAGPAHLEAGPEGPGLPLGEGRGKAVHDQRQYHKKKG
jgi:hypothetical protein